jgi:Domain of unknown function (DUF4384)
MKITIKVGLTVFLICFGLSCTAAHINKVITATGDILPKVLATVTHAFGGPYAALIDQFFVSATGSKSYQDEVERLQAKAGYPEFERPQGQSEYSNYDTGAAPYNDSQSDQYSQNQPQEQDYQNQTQAEIPSPYPQQNIDTGGESLQVSIDLIKEEFRDGGYIAVPVADGQTLTQSDNYKILFQSQTPCYMYIAQLDATGKMDPIFPSRFTEWRNPIVAGTLYKIPDQNKWFYLDANLGVETIYFIASRTQRHDIERVFGELEMKNQTLVQQNQVSMKYAYSITRGIGGVRPGNIHSVSFQNGNQGKFASTLFESVDADFVITRWFYHR